MDHEFSPLPADELEALEGALPWTAEERAWGLGRNPAGTLVQVVRHGGAVVGHVAAVPLRVWVDGREARFAGVADVRIDAAHRAGRSPGSFQRLWRSYAERCNGPEDVVTTYGFPDDRLYDALRILLGFNMVRNQTLLARPAGEGASRSPDGVERLEPAGEEIRWLYDRCCGDWGASAIRDADFYRWRFLDRPGRTYELLGVRDGDGVLRGLAAYGAGDELRARTAKIVDWLVPPSEPEVGEALLEGCLARARRDSVDALLAIFPEWSPWFDRFQSAGFRVHSSDLLMAARSKVRRFHELWLRDNWWYQLADTGIA